MAPLWLMLTAKVPSPTSVPALGASNVAKDWAKAFEQTPSSRLHSAKQRVSEPLPRVNVRKLAKASRSVSMCLTSFGCERKRPLSVRRRSGQSAAGTDAPPKRSSHDKRGAWDWTMKLWCLRMELWCPREAVGSHACPERSERGTGFVPWACGDVKSPLLPFSRGTSLCRGFAYSVALKASTRSAQSTSVTSVLKPWRRRGHRESPLGCGPGVALSSLHGGRIGALARSGDHRERGPQPAQRRLQQGHRPRVGIAHEEEHEEGSGQVVLDGEGVGDVEQKIDGQA